MLLILLLLLVYRIPLSLGNKVSSRLLARASRALLAPGAGPVSSASGKPISADTLATTGSDQSASSTTELRDSPSAVALRNGAGNLTDSNPSALGGTSPFRPDQPVKEEDPFIKDTEDLVRSMQASSPSWNEESSGNASPSSSYTEDNGARRSVPADREEQYESQGIARDESDQTYVVAKPESPMEGRWDRDGAIDMVLFDKGEGRKSIESSIASNGASRT